MKDNLLTIFSKQDVIVEKNSSVFRLLTPLEVDSVLGGDASCGAGGSDHSQGGGSYTQGSTGSYSQGGTGGGNYNQNC
jgi:hypothetical protein